MIRDRAVLVSQSPAGRHHRLDRIAAVAPERVHVEIAANVAATHERGQRPVHGRLHFTIALSNFRRDERETDRRVDVLFAGRDHRGASRRPVALGRQKPASFARHGSQRVEMRVRSRQMQQRGAREGRRWEADAELNAVHPQIQAPLAAMQDARDAWHLTDLVNRG